MDPIREQVRRARRRLSWELFLNRLLRCWFGALVLAVVGIAVPKLWAIEGLPAHWSLGCGAAGIAAGLLVALAWTGLRGRSELEAGVEIDRRYGLKERVASSLSLSPEGAQTPAGRALLEDAARAVGRIDVDEKFKVRFEQRAWLPLVPALLAFVLAMFVDNRAAQSSIDPQPAELTQEQRQDVAKKLRERLAERRQEAAKKGLKDAEGLFRELEKQTEKLAQAKDASRQQSLVKINDLAKQLEKRREKLGGEQQLRKQLEKLNSMNRGPADKLVEAMKKGDFQAAQQELKKIQQQLKAGQLDEQAKQQLQQQLAEIQEKLSAAQEAREQAIASLKKQIQQQQQQGNLSKAGELQQKLDQMQQQQNSMNPMQQLAQKMGDCQKCMQQGDAQGASQALDQMLEQMQQLEQQAAEGQMLDAALDQLQMTKDSMSCSSCQGAGCQACQGGGYSDQLGEGKNLGRGGGSRPDQKNEVRFRDTRVRQKPGKGSAVVVGEADGPNLRGQVIESVKTQMATEASQPADPLAAEQLPKSRREHNEQYFNSLRGE